MKALVVKRVSFCAAHFLPNYEGNCSNIHGHTWKVDVGVEGPIHRKSGMVIDFKVLKEFLEPILEDFDHNCLNGLIPNPTAENIAVYILKLMKAQVVGVKFIRVWESETSYAEVSSE